MEGAEVPARNVGAVEGADEVAGKEWEAGGKEVSEEEWALVEQPMRFVPVGFGGWCRLACLAVPTSAQKLVLSI